MPWLRSTGLRALEPRLPALVEVAHFVVGGCLLRLDEEAGRALVRQAAPVGAERVEAHVGGQPDRGDRREARVLLQGVEVAEPQHVLGEVGDGLAARAGEEEAPDAPLRVGDDAHPVGPERPDLAGPALGVALKPPVGRSPQVEVGLGRPPQVGGGPQGVGRVEQALHRLRRATETAAAVSVDAQRHARHRVLPHPDRGVDEDGAGVVVAVREWRPGGAVGPRQLAECRAPRPAALAAKGSWKEPGEGTDPR